MDEEHAPAKKTSARQVTKSPPGGRATLRGEQQRSIDARLRILSAALSEFAEKGFEAASIRSIGERAGFHFTLVTYHFETKERLWEEAIAHSFEEISARWQAEMSKLSSDDPLVLLRHQFHSFLNFTVEYPDFHRVMIQENHDRGPRMKWVMQYYVKPIMDAVFPNIAKAQKAGRIEKCEYVLFYYMLIGACTGLSSMGGEIKFAADLDPADPSTVSEYWRIVESILL